MLGTVVAFSIHGETVWDEDAQSEPCNREADMTTEAPLNYNTK